MLVSYINRFSSFVEQKCVAVFSKLDLILQFEKKSFGINKSQLPIALLQVTLSWESLLQVSSCFHTFFGKQELTQYKFLKY